jgi:hypothetical protein
MRRLNAVNSQTALGWVGNTAPCYFSLPPARNLPAAESPVNHGSTLYWRGVDSELSTTVWGCQSIWQVNSWNGCTRRKK